MISKKKSDFSLIDINELDLPTGENLLLLKMGFGEVKRDLKVMIMIFYYCNYDNNFLSLQMIMIFDYCK